MLINWFPGHMTKAVREMEANLQKVDAVVYVVDSRAVLSSDNPTFDRIISRKPILYLFNKADLVDKNDLSAWLNSFRKDGKQAISTVGTSVNSALLCKELKNVCSEKLERFKAKGANIGIRAMVIGVPNTGKSTIINSLIGKAKATTGNRPGVTRSQSWYSVNGIDFLDTPGTLWAKFEDQRIAHHLAYIGSIKDEICDSEDLCFDFLDEMKAVCPNALKERYKLNAVSEDTAEIFDAIAISRGFRLKGNEIDVERTAKTVMDDFRKGKLGKIMLEKAQKPISNQVD